MRRTLQNAARKLREVYKDTGADRWTIIAAEQITGAPGNLLRSIDSEPVVIGMQKMGTLKYHPGLDTIFYEEG